MRLEALKARICDVTLVLAIALCKTEAAYLRNVPYLSKLSISEGAPWACHEYIGTQNNEWCSQTKQFGEYELAYTDGKSQLCGACFCCRRKPILSTLELAVRNVTAKFKADARIAAQRVLDNAAPQPGKHHPFIFFHLRKAGGTTVRRQLVRAAVDLRVGAFVACEGNVPCETYDTPQHLDQQGDIGIYGGHFYYPSVLKSLWLSEVHGARVTPAEVQFDCFVMVRRPTSRVESCWNYRMVEEGGRSWFSRPRTISELEVAELAADLPTAMSAYGEGCNNEAVRVLSNSGRAEESVNGLTSAKQWSSMAPMLLEESLEHMQHCLVGVLERCEDTEKAVHGFFPWFKSFDCETSKERQGKITPSPLSAEAQREVEKQNALDMAVYEVANAMLDAQLAELQHPRTRTVFELFSRWR